MAILRLDSASMDPSGCLASQGGGGAALPFVGTFFIGSTSFLLLTAAAACCAQRSSGRPTPPPTVLASGDAWFGVMGTPTILLLVKLCIAFTVPQLVAFYILTAINDGAPRTAIADMACLVGAGFPVLGALFGGLGVLFVATSPLRLCNRDALAAAAVAGTQPRLVIVIPAGRGVFVVPLAAACAANDGDDTLDKVRVFACDAFGTPQCPDDAAWLRHNIACDLKRRTSAAPRVEVCIRVADFDVHAPPHRRHLPAASGAVDVILAPYLWSTRSDAVEGESAAARCARLHALLLEARRVLARGGRGRLVTIVPVFRRGVAKAALAGAGFDDVRALPGWHWLSFLPSVLMEARVAERAPTARTVAAADGDTAFGDDDEENEEAAAATVAQSVADNSSSFTARTVVRAVVYLATYAAGCAITVVLVRLLSEHWLDLSNAVTGASPGLPFSARVAAVSLALQLNIPVGLGLLLDGAWSAAAMSVLRSNALGTGATALRVAMMATPRRCSQRPSRCLRPHFLGCHPPLSATHMLEFGACSCLSSDRASSPPCSGSPSSVSTCCG